MTLAVVATSVSLVVIFLPVAFMTGYTQRFIYPFGFTMAFAVMVSLLVSLTLTPMLSARMLTTDGAAAPPRRRVLRQDRRGLRGGRSSGRSIIAASIVAVSLLVFASTFVLSAHGRPVVPAQRGQGEFQLTVDTPEGTSLAGHGEDASSTSRRSCWRVQGIAHVMPTIFERVNHSHIFIQLKPLERAEGARRNRSRRDVRKMMARIPSYKPTIVMRTPIGGGENASFPIQVNLHGTGPAASWPATRCKLLNEVQAMPGVSDSKASVNLGNPELRVAVDRQRAADLGVRHRRSGDARCG